MPLRIADAVVTKYRTALREPHRPPSRGGNTSALHAHYLVIDGEVYSFLALGTKRWVFAKDRVSFDYEAKGPYRNIIRDTIETIAPNGQSVIRGNRGGKRTLRTAQTRLPSSRREANN